MPGWRVQVSQEFTPEFVSYPNLRRFMSNELRNFLALSYDELEQLNLKAKEQRQKHVAVHKIQEERIKYLTDEKRIKAVTVLFSDLEGRLHMLDYDKKFLFTRKKATRSTPPTKSRGFSLPGPTPSAVTTKRENLSMSTRAATITRCLAIRCERSSTLPPKCSAPWAFRMKRTIPRSLLHNSKSTIAMAKSFPLLIRSSFTN